MRSNNLYEEILGMMTIIRDDESKLLAVLNFLESQILDARDRNRPYDIPEEYRNTIMQITEALEKGFVCYLNPDTMEIDQVENRGIFDMEEYQELNDDMLDEYALDYMKWDDYVKFEPLSPDEVLLIMQKFVAQLADSELARKLESVLGEEKPVTKFKRIIKNTDKKSGWDNYYHQAIVQYVSDRLLSNMQYDGALIADNAGNRPTDISYTDIEGEDLYEI